MRIEIDPSSGFCFGVEKAIQIAEEELNKGNKIYCLGQIVHNDVEVKRLENLGLVTLDYPAYKQLKNETVLLRAHGEPPETYQIAKENNIHLIDATCPIVINFQKKIKKEHELRNTQIVLFGQSRHPEIIGLAGQTENQSIIIEKEDDISKIDFNRPIRLYSQTTKSAKKYYEMAEKIQNKIDENHKNTEFKISKTLCGAVSKRDVVLQKFAANFELIIFVSGKKSSNGKMLYEICREVNLNSYFITTTDEIDAAWFKDVKSVGISGATSTPLRLLQETKEFIEHLSL